VQHLHHKRDVVVDQLRTASNTLPLKASA
jgi:hypothetical protein